MSLNMIENQEFHSLDFSIHAFHYSTFRLWDSQLLWRHNWTCNFGSQLHFNSIAHHRFYHHHNF